MISESGLNKSRLICGARMLTSLLKWSFVRHRYLFIAFTMVQTVFALAIVYGLTLMMGSLTTSQAEQLSAGVWQLGLVAVGCTIAPQLLSESISEGLLEYQRNLPVPRICLLIADFIIWIAVSIPGVVAGFVASTMKFGLIQMATSNLVMMLLLCALGNLSLGYMLAIWLPCGGVTVVGQLIMLATMLFAPIPYPSDKLPSIILTIHDWMPFVPMHRMLTDAAFPGSNISHSIDLFVVFAWCLTGVAGCLAGLSKRR